MNRHLRISDNAAARCEELGPHERGMCKGLRNFPDLCVVVAPALQWPNKSGAESIGFERGLTAAENDRPNPDQRRNRDRRWRIDNAPARGAP